MRYARINNSKVVEIIDTNGYAVDCTVCGYDVSVGYVLVDGEFVKPFELFVFEKLKELNQWHDSKTTEMKAKYSQSEVDSFLDKRNEAMAWRVDNTVATPYVTAMAGGNEVVRVALLNAILSKVDATAQLEAYVLMKRDEIEACTTQAELEAITW